MVNYDMPVKSTGEPDFRRYLHQIGRAGRFGESGTAVNFIDSPCPIAIVNEIEKHFRTEIGLWPGTNDFYEL